MLYSSFADFNNSGRHDISLLQFQNNFKVIIKFTKYSILVLAAEIGDLNTFKIELSKGQSQTCDR